MSIHPGVTVMSAGVALRRQYWVSSFTQDVKLVCLYDLVNSFICNNIGIWIVLLKWLQTENRVIFCIGVAFTFAAAAFMCKKLVGFGEA